MHLIITFRALFCYLGRVVLKIWYQNHRNFLPYFPSASCVSLLLMQVDVLHRLVVDEGLLKLTNRPKAWKTRMKFTPKVLAPTPSESSVVTQGVLLFSISKFPANSRFFRISFPENSRNFTCKFKLKLSFFFIFGPSTPSKKYSLGDIL